MNDTFQEEQLHLKETYAKICELRDALTEELEIHQAAAAQDLRDMSSELRPDVAGVEADEAMETLAAIETLNSVIDAYNQQHDFAVERLRRVLALLRVPYFAKVRLQMRPGRPARDIYIGTVGLTDERHNPLVVDWRSPVAETYYKQEMGPTSFNVDGRVRNVNLELRRQFDIERDILHMYFDTTVAIEDSLLLSALKRHHSEKLQDITATIQREQNEVVRHTDIPVLLVRGIAGSGKTSVLLQRIAYLFYQNRKFLKPEHVCLFSPNALFSNYIDSVLPSLGESNPRILTWDKFVQWQGASGRDAGANASPENLRALEEALPTLEVQDDDLREIKLHGTTLLKPHQIKSAYDKFSQFPLGPRHVALTCDELHTSLRRRLSSLSRSESFQEEMFELDYEEQLDIFNEMINPTDERETQMLAYTYAQHKFAEADELIDSCAWLRLDRIGARVLNGHSLSATEWLWLRVLICGEGSKDTRYVMIDEVQDYTVSQLMLLNRFFARAHFLLLGDEHQAIRENTASWDEIRTIFANHGKRRDPAGASAQTLDECSLLTSYRSSPEITRLFSSLLNEEERGTLSSVRRAGVQPRIQSFDNTEDYLAALREAVEQANKSDAEAGKLCAVVVADAKRVSWLAKQLGPCVSVVRKHDALPASGVVLLDLALAKGLEFDHVIVADAQEEVYPDTPLARRRLYTAISRAMHRATIFAQGRLTPLLDNYLAELA